MGMSLFHRRNLSDKVKAPVPVAPSMRTRGKVERVLEFSRTRAGT